MTVGGVTVAAWPWAFLVLGLALYGLGDLCWWAGTALAPVRKTWQAWRARRRRQQPRGISDDCWFGTHEDCDGCDCAGCGHEGPPDPLMGLPPERTWEQMTSHQLLIVTEGGDAHAAHAGHYNPAGTRGLDSAGVVREHEPRRVGAHLEAARERRMPGWEAESRQAYAALGLEYPSGLMARVREAAQ